MMRRSVVIALAVGLAFIGIAIIAVLARAPLTVVGANPNPSKDFIEVEESGALSNCQSAGTIPKGTTAIRIGIEGLNYSPAVSVRVLLGSQLIAAGNLPGGGVSAPSVTVPVGRFSHAVNGARICPTVGPALEPVRYYGVPVHSRSAQQLHGAALHVEYLRPDTKLWGSFLSSIAYHMGLGRAMSGTWIAFLALALVIATFVLVCRLTVEELR
jgi:hypothetical protein